MGKARDTLPVTVPPPGNEDMSSNPGTPCVPLLVSLWESELDPPDFWMHRPFGPTMRQSEPWKLAAAAAGMWKLGAAPMGALFAGGRCVLGGAFRYFAC